MHDYSNYRYILNDKYIPLTHIENEILNMLILEKGNIVTYEKICKKLFKSKNTDKYKQTLTIILYRLRKKLSGDVTIVTRNNIGYMII